MPKLTRRDWQKLRNEYHVAFVNWKDTQFVDLLNTVYPEKSLGSDPPDQEEVDNADAGMMTWAHAEPPIVPGP